MVLGPLRFTNALGGVADWLYPGPTIDLQSPASAQAVNATTYLIYAEAFDGSQWEIATGAYDAATKKFPRTSVLFNSLGTAAKINFSVPPQVYVFDITASQAALDARYVAFAIAQSLTAAQQAQALANQNVKFGQCALSKSGSNIVLLPKDGNLLTINGQPCAIPSGGVSLAPSGLTPATLYYVYATASAGAVNALEASITGHSTSATAGNVGTEIKTGDDTRTLVGMVYPTAGPAFTDSTTQALVLSYFNRKIKPLVNHYTASRAIAVATFTEFNSEIRCEFLCWADESVEAIFNGSGFLNVTGHAGFAAIAFDSAASPEDGMAAISESSGTSALRMLSPSANRLLSEGHHFSTVTGEVDNVTGAPSITIFFSAASNGQRGALYTTTRG